MNTTITVARWIVRVAGIVGLILGLVFWSGNGYALLKAHEGLGYLVTAGLLLLGILGFVRRLPPALPLLAVVWALAVPAIGSMQMRLLPGSAHWVIQVIHLLLGVGAIGLAEAIAGRARRA